MSHYNLRPREMAYVIHAVQEMIYRQFHFEPDKPVAICIFVTPMWDEVIARLGVRPTYADHPFVLTTLPLVEAQKLFANEPGLSEEIGSLYQTDPPLEEVPTLFLNGDERSFLTLGPLAPGIH